MSPHEVMDLMDVNAQMLAALRELTAVIDSAGLLNLTNGVQLGPTAWYVKAVEAMALARSAIEKAERR